MLYCILAHWSLGTTIHSAHCAAHQAMRCLLLKWPDANLRPEYQCVWNAFWWKELLAFLKQTLSCCSYPRHLSKCWDSTTPLGQLYCFHREKPHMNLSALQMWGKAIFQKVNVEQQFPKHSSFGMTMRMWETLRGASVRRGAKIKSWWIIFIIMWAFTVASGGPKWPCEAPY